MKPKIIFIHGMFLTAKSWEKWVPYFEGLGYPCEAPPWPLHDREPAAMRADPPAGLGTLGLAEVYRHYEEIIRREGGRVLAIGHSVGGLIVQKLAAAGLLRAGVCICPVAPNRMLSVDWDFLKNSAAITNPLAGDEPYEMTGETFRENFGNTMSEEESRRAWQEYAVPESRKVLRDILGEEGQIDTDKPHVPLLFLAAREDKIIPDSLVRHNAHAYTDTRSYHESFDFTGRGHFICGQDGWEEVALRAANWLELHRQGDRA